MAQDNPQTPSNDRRGSKSLAGRKVAFLATCGVEESELASPMKAVKDAGADVTLVSLKLGEIQGFKDHQPSQKFKVDAVVSKVFAANFDALVLPGGVANPDTLRADAQAVSFVRDFFTQHKPVAAICHGPWLLAEADVLRGRHVTSYRSIKTDLINAGAEWSDQECVVDQGLVTSRSPEDLEAFNAKVIEEIAEGVHQGQHA